MKLSLAIATLALGGLALALPGHAPAPTVGDAAPEFGTSGTKWFNHLGQDPNLASLRGKAVLIEFWATW